MKDKHENFIYSVLFHWKTFFTYILNSRHFPHISGKIFGNCQLLHVPHHTFDARFYQLVPMVRVNYMEKGTNTLRQITKFKFKITNVLCSFFIVAKHVRENSSQQFDDHTFRCPVVSSLTSFTQHFQNTFVAVAALPVF